MGYYATYTADDEEPKCGNCDYISNATESFCNECGRCGWCHYSRTEKVEVIE